MLGSQQLWEQIKTIAEQKESKETQQWHEQQDLKKRQERTKQMVKEEKNKAIQIWTRTKLGGEKGVVMAKEYGYQDGSGIAHVIKRLKQVATKEKAFKNKLIKYRRLWKEDRSFNH